MKIVLSIACTLFLLGCSESASQTPSTQTAPVISNVPVVESPSTTAETPPTTTAQTTEQTSTPVETPPVTEKPATPVVVSVDANTLYGQKCASCHGTKAEKAALGKSQVIATLSETQIKDALKGYQAGTYGKEMKALMQGQAKGLSDEQVDALAKHIATF